MAKEHLLLPDEQVMAYAELTQDLLFHKIPPSRAAFYVQRSLERGAELAAAARKEGKDIRELCRAAGISVTIADGESTFGKVRFRAEIEFSDKERAITVYRSSLRELEQACQRYLPEAALSFNDMVNIHLAHEYYHYLEYSGHGFTNELLPPVTTLSFGPLRRSATIVRCSEIAAHAFSKGFTGVDWLPNLFDYFYMRESGQLTEDEYAALERSWRSGWESALAAAETAELAKQ
ncbi:hypothetical protein J41TS12_14550 [Paenibacillus antibioticophila]|uniref:Uncharacterized protein n=1 Tax=Paenibacillus antibioticophila TaxID=1274374 RepID=A0A920CGY5_9BACL|nr:hypothetical protein [Paenibacillus antibioticophila]GIO36594.1 hypothetical protein J41TS12_14550 [Paenibacillus antibioticophila]